MNIVYSGWSKDRGYFHDIYSIDTEVGNLEIHFADGSIAKQINPFQSRCHDWNNDNDVYPLYGATFEYIGTTFRHFFTPSDLVDLVIEEKATIIGIKRRNSNALSSKSLPMH